MAIKIETIYTTNNSNTYLTADAFHAEHGPLGMYNLDYIMEVGTSELVNNQSIKVTLKYESTEKWNEHKAVTSSGEYSEFADKSTCTQGTITSSVIE